MDVKKVDVDLDIDITNYKTVIKIQEPAAELIGLHDYEKMVISNMGGQLLEATEVNFNAIGEAYYLLKIKKGKTPDKSFTQYECSLYPGEVRDRRIKLRPSQPEMCYRKVAEWIVKASGDDIPSMYPMLTCSECGGSTALQRTPYCPYCGSRMSSGNY